MTVDRSKSVTAKREGQTFFFCSEGCRDMFMDQHVPQTKDALGRTRS